MGGIKTKIKQLIAFYKNYKYLIWWVNNYFPLKSCFGHIGKTSVIGRPIRIGNPSKVYFEEYTNIRYGLNIINAKHEKVIIKKYAVIAPLCTIITNSHRATIGIPQFILGESHVNDISGDVIICEDVWVGANSTILAGVTIGRGAIVGACSLVSRNVPPYALVIGSPAKIVGVKFSKQGILKHEKQLYPVDERMSNKDIDNLFLEFYSDKKIFGVETPLNKVDIEKIDFVKKKHGL